MRSALIAEKTNSAAETWSNRMRRKRPNLEILLIAAKQICGGQDEMLKNRQRRLQSIREMVVKQYGTFDEVYKRIAGR